MTDAAQKDRWKYQHVTQWKADLSPNSRVPSNVNEVTRSATRPVDHPVSHEQKFSLLQKQLMALFIVAACAFLIAFEIGVIDWIYELVR